MLIYDNIENSYYEVIPVKKIEEKIEELTKKEIEYHDNVELGIETDVEYYEFLSNSYTKLFLQQLIKENCESEE